jgi:hypothetical protein
MRKRRCQRDNDSSDDRGFIRCLVGGGDRSQVQWIVNFIRESSPTPEADAETLASQVLVIAGSLANSHLRLRQAHH